MLIIKNEKYNFIKYIKSQQEQYQNNSQDGEGPLNPGKKHLHIQILQIAEVQTLTDEQLKERQQHQSAK